MASPVLALALVPLVGNWQQASRAGHVDTAAFAKDLLNSVEPYGILVTVGDNDTFPLWYAQEVEGIRKDVLIANTSLLNTDWYARQMVRRPVYEYDAAKGPAIYRGQQWRKPSGPPLKMTMQELDAIPLGVSLSDPQDFIKDDIRATITQPQLYRADLLVLYMIRDAYPERPMYFSRTSGGYAQELGLQNHVLTQGLARKLTQQPVVAGPGHGRDPGRGLRRPRALHHALDAGVRGAEGAHRPRRLGGPAERGHPGPVHDHRHHAVRGAAARRAAAGGAAGVRDGARRGAGDAPHA
jgi:hypothetical protein